MFTFIKIYQNEVVFRLNNLNMNPLKVNESHVISHLTHTKKNSANYSERKMLILRETEAY